MERKEERNILECAAMRKIPYSVPDGYFESVEERLRGKTFQTTPDGRWGAWARTLKAGLALAASFLIVAGLGWGVMRLTSLQQNRMAANNTSELTEEGFLMLDSLLNRYGAIEVAELYKTSQMEGYEPESSPELSEEEGLVLEEYITLMAPSFPGLLAEELTSYK